MVDGLTRQAVPGKITFPCYFFRKYNDNCALCTGFNDYLRRLYFSHSQKMDYIFWIFIFHTKRKIRFEYDRHTRIRLCGKKKEENLIFHDDAGNYATPVSLGLLIAPGWNDIKGYFLIVYFYTLICRIVPSEIQ